MSRFPVALAVLLLLAAPLPLTAQPRYRLIAERGAGGALVSGINNRGDVAGRTAGGDGASHAFVRRDGVVTALPHLVPDYRSSGAINLNEHGEVAGWSYAPVPPPFPGYSTHAAYWSAETGAVNLTPDTTGLSIAYAINNHGEIVGNVMAGAQSGAFLWRVQRDGTVLSERLTPPSDWTAEVFDVSDRGLAAGARIDPEANALRPFVVDVRTKELTYLPAPRLQGQATAVNNLDQVAGSVLAFNNASHITIWNRSEEGAWLATNLGTLPYPHGHCKPHAINNRQELVGTCLADGPVPPEAWLWANGKLTPVRELVSPDVAAHWQFYDAYDINDSGVIVGSGVEDGRPAGFILVPELPARRRSVRK